MTYITKKSRVGLASGMAGSRGLKTPPGPETRSCHLSALSSALPEVFSHGSSSSRHASGTSSKKCFSVNTNPGFVPAGPLESCAIPQPIIVARWGARPGPHTLLSLQEVARSASLKPCGRRPAAPAEEGQMGAERQGEQVPTLRPTRSSTLSFVRDQ